MSLHHWRRANLSASTDVQHRPQMYAFNGGRFLWGMIRWVQCLLKTSQSKQKQAGVMVERELRIISGPTQWCWSVIWPLFSVMSNLTRKYLQTSDQIKVTYSSHSALLLFSSFSFVIIYIFAFFLRLREWCHVQDKSHFQHEDNSCVTPHKQQWREERDARFLSWKYSQYCEFSLRWEY